MTDDLEKDINAFRPINKVSVTQIITERIISMIKDGTLKLGDKLPSQNELQSLFGVSKPALREAMTGLTMLGYIEPKVGSGYYVRNIHDISMISYEILNKLISDEDISDLFEARLLFETSATALAAKRATKEDIQKLYAYLDRMKEDVENIFKYPFTKEALQFHQLVIDCCHNAVLSAIERELLSVFKEYGRKVYSNEYIYQFDFAAHLEIVQCIERRDPQGAYEKSIDDIRGFIKTINGNEAIGKDFIYTDDNRG